MSVAGQFDEIACATVETTRPSDQANSIKSR